MTQLDDFFSGLVTRRPVEGRVPHLEGFNLSSPGRGTGTRGWHALKSMAAAWIESRGSCEPSDPKIKGWCPPVPAKCIFLQRSLSANTFFFKVSFHFEAQLLIPAGPAGFRQQSAGRWGCHAAWIDAGTAHAPVLAAEEHEEEAMWQVVVKRHPPLRGSTKAWAQKSSTPEAAAGKSGFGPWYLWQPRSPKQNRLIATDFLDFTNLWGVERPPEAV